MAQAPDIMGLMKRQQSAGMPPTPPPAPATDMADDSAPPMSSPMSTPEPKMGNKEGAMVNLSMAMDLIEQSLPSLGSESPEGQKVLSALRSLTGVIGPRKGKTNDLQQSEILQMLQNLPQAGGATPEGTAMSQAPSIPNMPPIPGLGGGAGSPPSAPPPTPPGAGAPPPHPPM